MLQPVRIVRNIPLNLGPSAPNKRKHGRVRCEGLRCLFVAFDSVEGVVLDISASGARVCMRRAVDAKPGDLVPMVLFATDARCEVIARLVWEKRRGFRRYEMGMTFGESTPELRQKILGIMRAAADGHVIYTAHPE